MSFLPAFIPEIDLYDSTPVDWVLISYVTETRLHNVGLKVYTILLYSPQGRFLETLSEKDLVFFTKRDLFKKIAEIKRSAKVHDFNPIVIPFTLFQFVLCPQKLS